MKKLILPLLILILFWSCEKETRKIPITFITIDGVLYTLDAFIDYTEEITGSAFEEVDNRVVISVLEDFVNEKLLLVDACTENGKDPLSLSEQETKKLIEEHIDSKVTSGVTVSDGEIDEYYQNHIDEYISRMNVGVWRIQIGDKEELARVRKLIEKGDMTFEEIAEKYSESPDRGKLVYYEKGTLPTDIEDVIFSLEKGQVSDPVPTSYGYHIFKIAEVRSTPSGNTGPGRENIRDILMREKNRDALNEYLSFLKSKYSVKIRTDLLSKGEE